jgi:hypothetical protein
MYEASLGDAMPQNFSPQTNKNIGNRIATELNQKPTFQPKSFNRRPNSKIGGSRSSTKMHEATIHDSHKQIRAQTPQNRRNKPHMKTDENSSKNIRKSNELQTGNRRNHKSFHSFGGQILYKWRKNLTLESKEMRSSLDGWFAWKP